MTDAIPIPPQAREAVTRALEKTAGEDLLHFARENLRGSFTKPALVRQHLTQQLAGQKELTVELTSLLRQSFPGRSLVTVLDPGTILLLVPTFSALLGRDTLILALLADVREKVQILGERLLRSPEFMDEVVPRPEAAAALVRMARDWLADLQIDPGFGAALENNTGEQRSSSGSDSVLPVSEAPSGAARLERLEKIVEDQKRRHKEELRALREQLLAERTSNEEARRRLEEERRLAVEACARAEGALQAERAARETLIQGTIENERKSLLRPWLREAENLVSAAKAVKADDLLARAHAVLEAQSHADRVSGTRRELEQRLEALRSAHGRLVDAGSNSLSPLPELTMVRGGIEGEIQRIASALGIAGTDSEVVRSLRKRIADAHSAEQLWALRPALDALQEHRLAAAGELLALERILLRKVSVLAETRPVDPPLSQEQSWSLRGVLERKIPSRLLIDGHNVILSLTTLFGDAGRSPQAEKQAREQLTAAVVALGDRHPTIEIELHLDGPTGRAESARRNVKVEFSGGTGSQRADAVILGRLRHLTMSDVSRPCYLVSDDRRLRDDAQREGARCVRTTAFALLLEDSGSLQGRGGA